MTTRLGQFIQNPEYTGVTEYVRQSQPGIALWCDKFPAPLIAEAAGWGCFNIGRAYFEDGGQFPEIMADPIATAERHYAVIKQRAGAAWPYLKAIMGANEYVGSDKFTGVYSHDRPIAEQVVRYERRMWQLCQADGKLYCYYSAPRGNVELRDWTLLAATCHKLFGVFFPGDIYACHEYWSSPEGPLSRAGGNDRTAPYFIGRWEFYDPMPSVIATLECGYESDPQPPKHGWQKDYEFPGRDPVYANHFRQYAELMDQLAARHNVTYIGCCGFVVGRDKQWISEGDGKGFDFTGIYEIAQLMAGWPKQHTERSTPLPTPATDKTETMIRDIFNRQGANWNPGDAFGGYILAQAKTGRIIYPMPSKDGSWQNFTLDGNLIIAYTNPVLVYNKTTGAVTEGNPFRG